MINHQHVSINDAYLHEFTSVHTITTNESSINTVVPLPRLIVIRQRQSKYGGSTRRITYAVMA